MSKYFKFDTKLVFLGFFVALFSAGIGIGGGTLLVSILISLFGFDFKKAARTSLSTIMPISFVGAISHFIFLPETPDMSYYYIFIPSCVLGTVLGGIIVQKHPNNFLKLIFSLFLLIISLRMMKLFDFPYLMYSELGTMLFANEYLLIVPIGICIGIIAVLLGIGCGLLIVPFYVIIIDLDIHEAITLSLTTMFFLSVSTTIINNRMKTLDITPLKSLLLPALVGAVFGAMISSHLPTLLLKKLFGVILFLIASNYLIHLSDMNRRLTLLAKNITRMVKHH